MPSPVVALYLLPASHPQARACAACTVRGDALFGALDEAGLHRIHADIATPALAAGERVYDRGPAAAAVYTVRSGIVRFERVTAGGHRRIVRLAGRGDLIGQEALVQRPHTDEAIACTEVQLCRIPRQLVDELGAAEPALLRELMQRWQRTVEAAENWAAELSTGPARRRVLQLLDQLERWADDAGRIWLPRREDMGAMLDMTIETASRMVSALRREGVLLGDGGRDTRVDRSALQRALRAIDAD